MSAFLSRTEVWVFALATAAFLALYWAFRGAPIGQAADDEGADAPRAAYRDRVIAAVVVGLLLIVGGAYIALARSLLWSIPVFAIGFGLVLALIVFNQRYRHASPALRRTIDLSNTALTIALVAGILIVINVLAFRYGGRAIDLTRERTFSLESLTNNQLKALDRPVTFTLISGKSPLAALQSERIQQVLDLYKAANPDRIRLETLDPYAEPEKFEAIVKRAPGVAVTQGGGVILIEYGAGEKAAFSVIRNSELFDLPTSGRVEDQAALFESTFHGETAITSALIALREGKKPKIYFTTGHGEPSLNESRPREPGIGVWHARLAATGVDVAELNLIETEVPADASLLVVVGPKSPFRTEEVSKIRGYLDRGSPALMLLGSQEKTGLEEILRSYNIDFGRGTIVDRRLSAPGRPQFVYMPMTPDLRHPIVDSLISRFVLMPSASPIRILGFGGSAPVNTNLKATPLLRSSTFSWAESDLAKRPVEFDQGPDEKGPLTVGVTVSEKPKTEGNREGDKPRTEGNREGDPRLVLFSSSTMADNDLIQEEPINQDLLMNAIAWLRGRPDLQGIAPRTHVSMTLLADPVLRFRLIMVPTVMAVLLVIGLGISTYVARRE
ncbi:GldG family protein [Singulisphaera sp. GP187]|uniref:GldG family protein n=1 Tax=Singulisphaera sp. GP187 TaxID=1882752 RepID=UPI0020B12C8D|nr:GldG family protein [Singulisphaera sp. GP187]